MEEDRNMDDLMEELPTKPLHDGFKWGRSVQIVRSGWLPELRLGEDRPYFRQDFEGHEDKSVKALEHGFKVLEERRSELSSRDPTITKQFLVPVLLLCGENVQAKEWTSARQIELSYKVLAKVKEVFRVNSVAKVLLIPLNTQPQDNKHSEGSPTTNSTDSEGQVLRWCVNDLGEQLQQQSGKKGDDSRWRRFPGSQSCFAWILHQFSSPVLGRFLPEFLPFSLRFVDDWEVKNKLVGVTCLNHIVSNSSPTELVGCGRVDLIEDALRKLLIGSHQSEEDLVSAICLCWFGLLEKIEERHKYLTGQPNRWDGLAKEFLYKMELESRPDLKKVYSVQLQKLLRGLGISCVRWMTATLRIISAYLEHLEYGRGDAEDMCRIACLDALETLLELSKTRVKAHAKTIFGLLIRLLYTISKEPEGNRISLDKCSSCLALSVDRAPHEFSVLCKGMDHLEVNPTFEKIIRGLFERLPPASKGDEVLLLIQKP